MKNMNLYNDEKKNIEARKDKKVYLTNGKMIIVI
jgi:hypothetical protein